MNKTFEFRLPYFKQGDDLQHCLQECKGDLAKAFARHAEMLTAGAQMLTNLAAEVQTLLASGAQIDVNADCHMIEVTGDAELLQPLVEKGLLELSPYDEQDAECPVCNNGDCICEDCSVCGLSDCVCGDDED